MTSIEIAKSQRKKAVKRIITGGIGCIIGIALVVYAVNLFLTHSWSFLLTGADGPTAVFVAGKIGALPTAVIGIIGAVILLYGIITIRKSTNSDK